MAYTKDYRLLRAYTLVRNGQQFFVYVDQYDEFDEWCLEEFDFQDDVEVIESDDSLTKFFNECKIGFEC
jgi:hypothetical protein